MSEGRCFFGRRCIIFLIAFFWGWCAKRAVGPMLMLMLVVLRLASPCPCEEGGSLSSRGDERGANADTRLLSDARSNTNIGDIKNCPAFLVDIPLARSVLVPW